jgi:GAF domain-containing protein
MNQKVERYELLIKQCNAMIVNEIPKEGNLCNLLAFIKLEMDFFWCGLYVEYQEGLLGLSVFSGLPACTMIRAGKGVCGTSFATNEVMIVPDVNQFPGYIACHTETQSEIVIPYISNTKKSFVLDVDSVQLNYFDEVDAEYLGKIAHILSDFV